jgi:nucleoside-diphosphate-sugar epimerase
MTRVAILGANGFIGNRTVEILHALGQYDVRPVVRRASAAALPRRFDLDVRVADGRDGAALAAAFQGCDSVIVSLAADPATITGVIDPIHQAAREVGVRRLIYLSSASVHGQAPIPGTDENAPLSDRQPLAYNNAKVAAEVRLERLNRSGGPETVILRPGIVFGPRSQWIGGWADEVLSGSAYLVDGAKGLCNAIYVDDVVHAITLAMMEPKAPGRAYLLGQREQVTWRDLYAPVCEALGIEIDSLPDFASSVARPEPGTRPSPLRRFIRRRVPKSVRAGLQSAVRHRAADKPFVSIERAQLQTAQYVPPWTRARDELGYEPLVSFQDGLRHSIKWLAFAGYPVMPR